MPVSSKAIHEIINLSPLKKLFTENRFFVKNYFNFLYRQEDPYLVEKPEVKAKFDRAFALLDGFKGQKGLEIGCGEGRITHYLAAKVEQVIACDISSLAIKRAREINRDSSRIEYRVADILTTNLTEKYDLIFCSEVLYYLNQQQLKSTIQKIINILEKQGKLLLLHARSLKDDTEGLELKEFGAKTIHEAFISDRNLIVERDLIEREYRITLLAQR